MASSSTEDRALSKLRDQLKDVLSGISDEYFKSDIFLLRFLREQDGNIDGAEKLIRATLAWRRENGIDALANQPLDAFCATNFPISIGGRDRAGRPLVTVAVGRWDLRQANTDENRIIQFRTYNLQIYERIMAEIQRAERERLQNSGIATPITQYTVIYDWEGFSYRPMLSVSLDKRMAQITATIEANYPDTLANCIYINCSSFISTVLSILKPVMSSRTFGKIKHFGCDRLVWVPAVLELVDPSQLPPQFGGTKVS